MGWKSQKPFSVNCHWSIYHDLRLLCKWFVQMSNLCISMTFKWKKKHWKILSHTFYNLTWMSLYFIFHLFKMQYMWYTITISINLYACTIAQYTVKIVTNKRATKHERNVDPSRTCINRQRQNMSKHTRKMICEYILRKFFRYISIFLFWT